MYYRLEDRIDGIVKLVAHELTHAEVYYRLYQDKRLFDGYFPRWFNEGLATQINPKDYDVYGFNKEAFMCNNNDFDNRFGDIAYISNRDLVKNWMELNKDGEDKSTIVTELFEEVIAGKDPKSFLWSIKDKRLMIKQ